MRAPSPEHFNYQKRQKSCLPFVSWEDGSLHQEEETRIDGLAYPLDPPDGTPGLSDEPAAQAHAFRTAIWKLVESGIPEAFRITSEHVGQKCLAARIRPRLHHGLTRPFYSWAVTDDAKLFELVGLDFLYDPKDLRHLLEPEVCDLRFTQGGDGLVGVDPRYVAWRAWRLYEHCELGMHDFLMDLRSFAWYSLQHPIPHERLILGGSHLEKDHARLVVVSPKPANKKGWMVDVLPHGRADFSDYAVAIMS
ncbi:hypothetical protein A3E39_02665 [Candidatus Uhrbacteria bacterium RIFCSPHIGHO2_12_FULL_60_25]|uniref:Uncharacterized protein n=1 Tax=Candidatus Uhrbacteria bacterium RIFCSPHIGHO2_12_FULL_60_25 TaxID=1802399 RepID=A0A1F7UJD1_9BACT|nr:MAG: hypothetical protein A3E39_02665 [Candidatus Uhrbacteria bacterium RIFCSPHIGHO2_12_FULL_60_25]